jgi:integrase/recombinase XerC
MLNLILMADDCFFLAEDIQDNLKDWLNWLQHGRHVSPHTLTAYQRDLSAFLSFLSKHQGQQITLPTLEHIALSDFRAWLADLARQDYDARSSRRALSALHNFYRFLSQHKALTNTEIGLVRMPRLKQTLPRALTIPQTLSLLTEIPALNPTPWIGARDCALFTLIYGTGLRIAEALSLRYGDWLPRETLTIMGKGRKQRVVPLLPIIHEAMAVYLKACPHILTAASPLFVGASGKPLHASVAQRHLRTYRQALGLPEKTTPHALRHSCATHLMINSHDLRGIQELLGHAQLSSTQIYTHLDHQQLLETFTAAHPRMGKEKSHSSSSRKLENSDER